MKRVLILFLFLLILFSCTMKKIVFEPNGAKNPPYQGEVIILDKLPDRFIDIGWINIVDNKTWIEMYTEAKEHARQHGANAIIYSSQNNKFIGTGSRSIICRAIFVKENTHDK